MQKIDFEIIWKKYHDTITKEENEQLQMWLLASKRHQKYFDNVIRFYSEGSLFDKNPIDSKVALGNIQKRLQTNNNKKYYKLVFYASSVAASILVNDYPYLYPNSFL